MVIIDSSVFNEDYFQRGIEKGISCYTSYSWRSDLTLPMAFHLIEYLGITKDDLINDYGCSMGFLVKAFRMLSRQAYGCDISEYAIGNCDPMIKDYVKQCTDSNIIPFDKYFNYTISKDVFEHIPESCIDNVLSAIYKSSLNLFAVIPLGINNKFVVPQYEKDCTHVLKKDVDWWLNRFKRNHWKIHKFSYYVTGIKESWSHYKMGNGFFWLNKVV